MKKKNFLSLVAGIALISGLGVTSAFAKCGGSATAKPVMKCGAGKCGGSMMAKPMSQSSTNALLQSEIKKVNNMKCGAAKKAVFLNIAELKKQMAKEQMNTALNMKCGASKKAAIMNAQVTEQSNAQGATMKCGASRRAPVMRIQMH